MPVTAGLVLGGAQTVIGLINGGKAKREFNAAMKQRKAFVTPEETHKILQATQANAQSGFDPATLGYLTSQNDRAFSSSLDTLQRLGGDANSASTLFDQQLQNIMKIGAQDQSLRLENFSKFMGALDMMAGSKAAEYTSQQNIIKDKLQGINANRAAAAANLSNGLNTIIGAGSAYATSQLYKTKNPNTVLNSSANTIDSPYDSVGTF